MAETKPSHRMTSSVCFMAGQSERAAASPSAGGETLEKAYRYHQEITAWDNVLTDAQQDRVHTSPESKAVQTESILYRAELQLLRLQSTAMTYDGENRMSDIKGPRHRQPST